MSQFGALRFDLKPPTDLGKHESHIAPEAQKSLEGNKLTFFRIDVARPDYLAYSLDRSDKTPKQGP